MKASIIKLFLRREHLILLTKVLHLQACATEEFNLDQKQCGKIMHIDINNQRLENKIIRTEKWSQNDLDDFQVQLLQIANLMFSYIKLHFPANSNAMLKDHIKFIQQLKQINYGGITVSQIIHLQRHRLSAERMKHFKQMKLVPETVQSKVLTQQIDMDAIDIIHQKYFQTKQHDHKQHYQILNLSKDIYSYVRNSTKEISQHIATFEDVPLLQQLNTNPIQPILNFDQFTSSIEERLTKLMARNFQVNNSIKQFHQQWKMKGIDTPLQSERNLESARKTNCKSQNGRRKVKKQLKMKMDPLKMDPLKMDQITSGGDDSSNNGRQTYKIEHNRMKSPVLRTKFYTSPSCITTNNTNMVNSSHNEKYKLLERGTRMQIKPIDYQSLCFGAIAKSTKNNQSEQNGSQKSLYQSQLETQQITLPNVNINASESQRSIPDRVSIMKDIKQQNRNRRYNKSNEQKDDISRSNYSLIQHPLQQSIPLLSRKNLEKPISFALFNNYKSEQLLTTLITSGSYKQKQSELYKQYIQPIVINSNSKQITIKPSKQQQQIKVDTEAYNLT